MEAPVPPVVLIYGPTASGKSALALRLAEDYGGVVINADALQVYAELRVLTDRPGPEEERSAPHRLYGFQPVRDPYSTARWLADAKTALAEAKEHGWLPIIVGGTGLYFTALTTGLSAIPEVPEEVREKYRRAASCTPPADLHRLLASRDPLTAARLRPSDPQRIVRALEVHEATGRSLAEWHENRQPPIVPLSSAFALTLNVERDELYRRCDARFDRMIALGAIEEARRIAALGLDRSLPAMRAVGLPPLLEFVRGGIGLEEASRSAKTQTRNYVKRQTTWMRKNFITWRSIDAQFLEGIKRELDIFIEKMLDLAHLRA
jgi:tRNA dimethylallyltransferase